jgi:hypothetical protein
VTRSSYAKALDALLAPLGFQRNGNDWIRVRGDMWECVDLQVSGIAGVTANVAMKDLETERVVTNIPSAEPISLHPVTYRIGVLIDGHDKWWRNDPAGPTELVEAVRVYGLPWFDKVRTLEDQAARWYGRRSSEHRYGPSMIPLAVTLFRLGEIEEACAALPWPPPRTAIPSLVARVEAVRRWLACPAGN